jgi:outer membrane receptor protein involved in Fe transport
MRPRGRCAPAAGEIVVTATHKSESLQKVPISIQALSPETLSQHQVASVSDYANLLPSVSFSTLGPGRSEVFFRGISVDGGQMATAGVYLDDIPITSPGRNPDPHIYDIERVEALSGPQGTLFGASSLAGTMRIITNKAKLGKFEAGYDAELNKTGKGQVGETIEGYVNIPINDRIALRLTGFYEHDGGYIDNVHGTHTYESVNYTIDNASLVQKNYNPSYSWGGRATATIQITPDWTATPSFIYQGLDSHGSYNYDPRVGDLQVRDYSPTRNQDEWYQAALTIQGKIADFDIVSATGYFRRHIRNSNDYTYYTVTYDKLVAQGKVGSYYTNFFDKNGNILNPTQQYLGHQASKKFTQELRVSVPKSWPFQLTVGGFYQFQKTSTDDAYYIPGLSTGTSAALQDANGNNVSPAVGGFATPDAYYLVELDQHYKDGAVFAEGNYDILKNLKLNAGVRYFVSDNGTYGFSGTWASAYNAGCGFTSDQPYFIHPSRLSCINNRAGFHQTGETHKAGLSWQFQPSKMVYFTYSTGFRPGGGNRIAPQHPYKADTLTNYELGVKTTWGRNLRLNAAIYHEVWQGVQYGVIPSASRARGLR